MARTTGQGRRKAAADEEPGANTPRMGLGRLENILGFHLRMAGVAIYQDFSAAMAGIGLTQKQVAVMELISENPGASQIEIAGRLAMDRATMMALVNRLEERDLVERRPSSVDRRRQELHLTGHGAATLEKCRLAIDDHERRLTARFSEDELKTLVGLLKRISTNGGQSRDEP
jgi:DNA-binding MarR family transcriptional regulator